MAELQNIIPERVVTEIAANVTVALANYPRSDDDVLSSFVPGIDELRAAINAVFWASIEQEEGRPALPRVALGDLRDMDCRITPCPLIPGSLRKLSPFLDNDSNFLHCSKDLQIVGVGPIDVLDVSVHAERPGTLVVSHLGTVLAILEGGEWHLINRDAQGLAGVLEGLFGEDDQGFRLRKAYILIMLAVWARAAKRGALFIMTPPNEHYRLGLPPAYEVTSFNAGREALVEGADLDNIFQFLGDMRRYHQHRAMVNSLRDRFAAVVSAGAGIDGATLLDEPDLRPVGFGVKINAPADDELVKLLSFPGTETLVAKKDLGGMRHQSAARLVQANHAATVVAVSQDGTISLFTWGEREERVLVVKHLDRFLRAASNSRIP